MDEPGIEARKLAPLRPWLARIDAVRTRDQLVRLMMQPGYAAPVRIGVGADQDDPTRYVVGIGQARLGLPARDYYLLKGEKYDAIRKAYRDYIVRLGTLAGGRRSDRPRRSHRRAGNATGAGPVDAPNSVATRSRPTTP